MRTLPPPPLATTIKRSLVQPTEAVKAPRHHPLYQVLIPATTTTRTNPSLQSTPFITTKGFEEFPAHPPPWALRVVGEGVVGRGKSSVIPCDCNDNSYVVAVVVVVAILRNRHFLIRRFRPIDQWNFFYTILSYYFIYYFTLNNPQLHYY